MDDRAGKIPDYPLFGEVCLHSYKFKTKNAFYINLRQFLRIKLSSVNSSNKGKNKVTKKTHSKVTF